jgi:hypothetical protein
MYDGVLGGAVRNSQKCPDFHPAARDILVAENKNQKVKIRTV